MPTDEQFATDNRSCPKCGGIMKWFASEAKDAMTAVQHRFSCVDCSTSETIIVPMTSNLPDLGNM